MKLQDKQSLRGWRAGLLLAAGAAIGLGAAAAPAASSRLWAAHRLDADSDATAYAFVRAAPETALVEARSRGFAAVRHAGEGSYCLTPVPGQKITTRVAVASPEWTYSSGSDRTFAAFVDFGAPQCSHGELAVLTTRGGDVSDGIAFSVVVP